MDKYQELLKIKKDLVLEFNQPFLFEQISSSKAHLFKNTVKKVFLKVRCLFQRLTLPFSKMERR